MKGEEGEKGDKKQGTNKAYRESEKRGEREERRVEEVKGRGKKYCSETGQKGTSIQQHISERTRSKQQSVWECAERGKTSINTVCSNKSE